MVKPEDKVKINRSCNFIAEIIPKRIGGFIRRIGDEIDFIFANDFFSDADEELIDVRHRRCSGACTGIDMNGAPSSPAGSKIIRVKVISEMKELIRCEIQFFGNETVE